jgi:hypothetical protein
MNIRWIRVILGALLLEAVLFAVLVPIGAINQTLFLAAVPIGCFVFGYAVTLLLFRRLADGFLAHGVLLGIIATAVYFALVLAGPGGMAAALAVYGIALFSLSQAARILGCVMAALVLQRRAALRLAPVQARSPTGAA